jgi:hypothetical protein
VSDAMNRRESKRRRVRRVRELYLVQGLDAEAMEETLRSEGLITSPRRESALRLIRGDMAEIDSSLRSTAVAIGNSDLALARWIEKNEALYRRLVQEFDRIEGVKVSETKFRYPNGAEGESVTTTKADPGGQRIRALALALECARNVAEAQGAAISGADGSGDEEPPPFLGIVIGLSNVSPEANATIREWQKGRVSSHGQEA